MYYYYCIFVLVSVNRWIDLMFLDWSFILNQVLWSCASHWYQYRRRVNSLQSCSFAQAAPWSQNTCEEYSMCTGHRWGVLEEWRNGIWLNKPSHSRLLTDRHTLRNIHALVSGLISSNVRCIFLALFRWSRLWEWSVTANPCLNIQNDYSVLLP